MATPYTNSWQSEMRAVTPAANNTRLIGAPHISTSGVAQRYSSAPRMGDTPTSSQPSNSVLNNGGGGGVDASQLPYGNRSLTPNRYMSSFDRDESNNQGNDPRATPSSTGLIRLSLKKPMGIVFEPMYDPNQKSLQRGVRICDLPRTGAAALSRKLQVGDELLQINDKTVSRLNFDQIMDFIIEADPESVNLLFRRPRKETLQARQGVQQKLNAAANKDNPTTVKWVDESNASGERKKKERKDGKRDKKKRIKKGSVSEDEDETLQSSTVGDDSYTKTAKSTRKKSKSKKNPYESESFLDLLIDTICSNSNNVCRDTFRRNDEEYYSEDESFVTDAEDESTYVTFDESVDAKAAKNKSKGKVPEKRVMEAEDDTLQDEATDEDASRLPPKRKEKHHEKHPEKHHEKHHEKPEVRESKNDKKKYEDDGTLETVDSVERTKPEDAPGDKPPPPLGLAPQPLPDPPKQPIIPQILEEPEDISPAPIKEVEYDDRIDHGADVSVMESLGGPSLLIEKQRAAVQAANNKANGRAVPTEIIDKYGLDYPVNFGMTREQTIEADPLKYYVFVVKGLLEEHEPEKVRLLDKLLAKYRGREDHLVQKLSVRYDRALEAATPPDPEEDHDAAAFTDAVKKSKASSTVAAAVHTAKERMHISEPEPIEHGFEQPEWPDKETKEPDTGDDDDEEEETESGSDYSRDSVDGTSPAVIAQVSELLNYVYGKTSVPGQIDRVSTIMRAYEGREAVLLELLETKALIKANKEKENADNLPSFLRNSQQMVQARKNAENLESTDLPPVTPMATQPVTDDISSMSGVSSPAQEQEREPTGIVSQNYETKEVEVTHTPVAHSSPPSLGMPDPPSAPIVMREVPKLNTTPSNSTKSSTNKPAPVPVSPEKDKKKKKGLFGGLFGGLKGKKDAPTPASRSRRKSKG